MSKKLEFTMDLEAEVECSVTPFRKGKRADPFDQPDPDEEACVEDLCVGVIVKGRVIDITGLLNPTEISVIEEECFMRAKEKEIAREWSRDL